MTDHITNANSILSDLTTSKRDILAVLDGAGMTRETVRALLADRYDGSVVDEQLALKLNQLVDASLVRKHTRDDRSDEYQLTVAGRETIRRHAAWIQAETAYSAYNSSEADSHNTGAEEIIVPREHAEVRAHWPTDSIRSTRTKQTRSNQQSTVTTPC